MSTTLPPTEPMSPTMRQTLELLKWAAEGLANANRVRRARLSGAPEFSGAEVMAMYLKSQGIDIPRIDEVLRGLLEDGTTAAAVKDVVDLVSDAAVKSPKDLSDLVQRLASAATGTLPQPSTTPATAPPGATWTVTPSGKLKFRSATAASAGATPAGKPRFRPEYTSAACSSGVTPHAPQTADPPPPAANEVLRAEPPVCADVASPTSAVSGTATCACTDATPIEPAPAAAPRPSPADEASEARTSGRLDSLERRLDVFEADQAREFSALRQLMTEHFRGLSDLLAGNAAASNRLSQEHEALGQRVQQLESTLARLDALEAKLAETSSSEPARPDGSAPTLLAEETPPQPKAEHATSAPANASEHAETAGARPDNAREAPAGAAPLHEGAAVQPGKTVVAVGPVAQTHDTCPTDQETPRAQPVGAAEDAGPKAETLGARPETVREASAGAAPLHEGAAVQPGKTVVAVGPVAQTHDTCPTDQETPRAQPVGAAEDAGPKNEHTQDDVTHHDENTHETQPAQQGDKSP